MPAEQRSWMVDAPDADKATEAAMRQARIEGWRIKTLAACRPAFGSIDQDTGLPNRWDVRLAVERREVPAVGQ